MGIEVGTALIISAVVSGVGTAISFLEQRKAGKAAAARAAAANAAQRRAEQAQQRAADLQAARRRRELVREARIRRAQIIQGGVSAGVGLASSAIRGGVGAVRTDVGATLSFLDQTRALNQLAREQFGIARTIASTPIQQGGFGAAVSQIGATAFAFAGSPAGASFFGASAGPVGNDASLGITRIG